MRPWLAVPIALVGISCLGCQSRATASPPASDPPAPGQVPAAALAEAKHVYATQCALCHGQNGKGDGPLAASVNPKPQDYTNAQFQRTVSDATIRTAIVKGGAAVGKSSIMPPHPDLADKPEVVAGLVQIIRDFGRGGEQ